MPPEPRDFPGGDRPEDAPLDGFELLAVIMESYPDIPVIVISGFSSPNMQRLARQGGAVAFIAKPSDRKLDPPHRKDAAQANRGRYPP